MKDVEARSIGDALSFPVQEQIIPVVFPLNVFAAAGVTFAFAGAVVNKIKIASADKTADYVAGRVVHFTQDATVKYFTVVSSVLVGADTIVTLLPFASEVVTTTTITVPKIGKYIRSAPCSYSAAGAIKIAGLDLTARFAAGVIIKFTQGTTEKLFVVASSSVVGSDTIVVLTALNGTTVANAAILEPFYAVPAAAAVTYVYTAIPNEIKIAGSDETASYVAGVLVRFTQDTVVKNFTVVSSSFSTDTTVLLTPVASEVVTNTTITTPLIATTTPTVISEVVHCNGTVGQIVLTVPALASSDTANLSIKNAAGVVLYTTGVKAHTASYVVDGTTLKNIMLAGNVTISVTLSAAQAAAATITVTLYSR